MKKSLSLFVFTFFAVFSLGIETASAAVSPAQCTSEFKGTCKAAEWSLLNWMGFHDGCDSTSLGYGDCTTSGQVCCTNHSDILQIPRNTCEAQKGFCTQTSCFSSGYPLLGMCSDTGAGYYCCGRIPAVPTDDKTPGTAAFCINTMKGDCRTASSAGCGADKFQVQTCPGGKICCSAINVSGGPLTGTYQLLEKIPGSTYNQASSGKLNVYLQDIYNFAFWAIGIAVVFMLTLGGFLYLTSAGNTSRLGNAKTIIFDAFLGLILALVAWIFLNLINPDLTNLTLPTTIKVNPTLPVIPPGNSPSANAALILKNNPSVSLSTSGDCEMAPGMPVSPARSIQQQSDNATVIACHQGCPSTLCSRETTLNETMLTALNTLSASYPIIITSFTGGSHEGDSAHYNGRAVDFAPRVPKSEWDAVILALRTGGASPTKVFCDNAGAKVPCSDATHIHAQW